MGTGVSPKRIVTGIPYLSFYGMYYSGFSSFFFLQGAFFLDNFTAIQSLLLFLRKEVIQPQVLLRLPCYDFTPVIGPAFDGALTRLSYRLRALPTPMV